MNSHSSGVFPSPDTPCHEARSLRICEGWSSERIPLCRYGSRSYINTAALMPFSGGRSFPSKWDDAERWISSPVLGNGNSRIPLVQSQRRTKSKSGPLGPSGLAFRGISSPILPAVFGGSVRNSVALDSPASAGEIPAKRFSIGDEGGRQSCQGNGEQDLGFTREWLEMPSNPASPISPVLQFRRRIRKNLEQELEISAGYNSNTTKDAKTEGTNGGTSTRDVATQMLSEGSSCSSPSQRSSLSSQMEIRDVQVDRQANAIRSSEKTADTTRNNCTPYLKVLCHNATDIETAKLHREEAKINAWENLQKAKAEAAIRQLERKLEKKRSSSMDKIMKKLRRAQLKAEKKRSSLSEGSCNKITRRTSKMAFLLKSLDKLNKKLEQMLLC